jgi:hypothetical protein
MSVRKNGAIATRINGSVIEPVKEIAIVPSRMIGLRRSVTSVGVPRTGNGRGEPSLRSRKPIHREDEHKHHVDHRALDRADPAAGLPDDGAPVEGAF